MTSNSPFLRYRDILVHESYSAAIALQDFALSCYNGSLAQFRGDALSNFDAKHFEIFLELANYYHRHGESDQHLLETGAAICERRREHGRQLQALLAEHRTIKPSEYEEGTESQYWERMVWLQRQVEKMIATGWIDAPT